ncbi:hypothetical protein MRQ88_03420 [Streptomyces sp. MMS20-AI2-20]|nr:hypothetical protein [Streptomyces sp. MMS20-AI2-20]
MDVVGPEGVDVEPVTLVGIVTGLRQGVVGDLVVRTNRLTGSLGAVGVGVDVGVCVGVGVSAGVGVGRGGVRLLLRLGGLALSDLPLQRGGGETDRGTALDVTRVGPVRGLDVLRRLLLPDRHERDGSRRR